LILFQRYYQSFTAFLGRKNSLQNFSEGFIRKEEKNCGPREKIYIKPRILVCAPSNAAVNQICEKVIKVGFKQSDNMIYWPGIIRLAAVDALIPSDMKPILIQTKICSLLSLSETEWSRLYSQCYYNILALNQQIQNNNLRETVIEKIDQYIQSVEARDRDVADLGRLELVRTKYTSEFYLEKNASISKLYVELETSFVDEAEIVFTTLALCGRHTFRSISRTFDLLLIDEAAQANELTTLIPLTLGIKHCLLIGDNFQLPSTVISKLAKIAKFDRSLFQRLLENNYNFISLSIQYRMHPEICSFPSRFFYGGSLVDDPASSIKVQLKTNWPTAPYLLFDTTDTSELRGRSGSVVNVSEVHMIISILKSFMFMNPGTSLEIVAILTPYKEQKELIRNTLSETFGKSSSTVHISTIDGYQGKESDFVLISCVRAIKNIGFLSDAQRLNVAITRAKNRCWVLGNLSSLRKDRIWRYVVEDAVSRFCIIQGRESQAFLRSFFKCIKVL
jgi:senataxin